MAITIKFDSANNPLPARLILATKAGNKIRELPISDVKFRDTFLSGSEFSFNVYKNQCLTKSGEIDESFWRRIVDFKLAYCTEYDLWYEIHLDLDESDETIKSCTAVSLGEAELSQINLYGIEINTEADIARENYKPTVLYDPEDKEVSLVDRLLYKAPHYRVKHVDYTIANIQRSFSFNDISIFDAYQDVATEYNCIFIIEARKGVDSKIDRTISVYDAENYCLDCRNRGEFSGVCDKCGSTNIKYGYGEDTSIFVSRKNLAQEINYSTDVDSVKNCFRLEGGDDLMTATIINCNPNGSQYLWYITDAMKSDMSEALRQKLSDYDSMYEAYQSTESYSPPANLRNQYNQIVQKYGYVRNGNKTLQVTVQANRPNAQSLVLDITQNDEVLEMLGKKEVSAIDHIVEWQLMTLHNRLKTKHKETFWISVDNKMFDGKEFFKYSYIEHTRNPNIAEFDNLIMQQLISLELLLNRPSGRGDTWNFKIKDKAMPLLFPESFLYKLDPNSEPHRGPIRKRSMASQRK